MTTPSFQGEVMLAGWSETHAGGAKIVLWLPDADSLNAFRAMTVRKGNVAGQRFVAVLVEIGDDELPVAPAIEGNSSELKGLGVPAKPPIGPLCLAAVSVGATTNFCRFVSGDGSVEGSARYIRTFCKVKSRRELDTNAQAGANFRYLMAAFNRWQFPTTNLGDTHIGPRIIPPIKSPDSPA